MCGRLSIRSVRKRKRMGDFLSALLPFASISSLMRVSLSSIFLSLWSAISFLLVMCIACCHYPTRVRPNDVINTSSTKGDLRGVPTLPLSLVLSTVASELFDFGVFPRVSLLPFFDFVPEKGFEGPNRRHYVR
jgi:hypothetical protein